MLFDSPFSRLYQWSTDAREPLRSYSTGILAAVLDLPEVSADPENRERNNRVVPIMLKRLKDLTEVKVDENGRVNLERPFEGKKIVETKAQDLLLFLRLLLLILRTKFRMSSLF